MLKTFALRGRDVPLVVYGPPACASSSRLFRRVVGAVSYPLELVELRAGDMLERDDYKVLVFPVSHSSSSLGYAPRGAAAAGPLRRRGGRCALVSRRAASAGRSSAGSR
jgi:ribonuclease BN (tRNA processing enzyme)